MKSILIFLFFVSTSVLKAQYISDTILIAHHIRCEEANLIKQKDTVKIQKSNNPIKAILFIPLFVYQKVLSEQISAGCEFDRSCSNFSISAIKEYRFIKGILLTADRLTRCNGKAQIEIESHLINHKTGKVIDEPSMYRFKN